MKPLLPIDHGLNPSLADILPIFCPLFTVCLFISVPVVRLCLSYRNGKPRKGGDVFTSKRQHVILLLCSWAVFLSFVFEAVIVVCFSLPKAATFYPLSYSLIWLCLSVLIWEIGPQLSWPPYILSWAATALSDVTLVFVPSSRWSSLSYSWSAILVSARVGRVALLAGMISSTAWILTNRNTGSAVAHKGREASDEETQSLLRHAVSPLTETSSPHGAVYGSTHLSADENSQGQTHDESISSADSTDNEDEDEDEDDKEIKQLQQKRLQEKGGWLGYLQGFLIFLPYILPYKDRYTQFWIAVLVVCIAVERVLTVMIPRQLGFITEALGGDSSSSSDDNNNGLLTSNTAVSPSWSNLWSELLIWGLLQFPVAAVADLCKNRAKTRISQFAYRELKALSFAHVMNLSMDYHTAKSSGRLTKAIEQGTDLSTIIDNVFTAGPMLIDLAVAAVYLSTAFDFYMGFIVLTTALVHMYVTVKGNALIVPIERVSIERVRVENEVLTDSITNWPTVAYHNRKAFEQDRYASAVRSNIMAQRRHYDGNDYSYFAQSFALDVGMLVAASTAAYRVVSGTSSVSSFVFLIAYWTSIKEPMSMLSWTFRETSAHLISAEWLFQLLQMKPTIRDKPNAGNIAINQGKIEFRNVSFSYDVQRPIIKDISFTAKPNQSIALVGETGGGKSTILKLLYRFYDVTHGSILIDGQDIRDVTLDSLRDSLGAVPQDPSVFDQSILENVRYAHPDATDEDVIAACKAAHIHDQILRFPAGYGTKLGERGVRVSGGELQRLAIARVLLRRPRIVVLDEATSAVDSQTESSVQQALKLLGTGRTVFIVAHRLSTVVNADSIIVIDQGRIAEQGSHHELLARQGPYSKLWSIQTTAHTKD